MERSKQSKQSKNGAKKVLRKKRSKALLKYEVEHAAVEGLKPHPRNYRTHPEDQLAHLVASIEEHGFYRNVIVARDGTILAGHGVVEAAKKMKLRTIPVIRLNVGPDDPNALKVLTGDNQIAQLGEIDDRALTELLKQIKEDDEKGLLGTGFDDQMLASLIMVTRPAGEVKDFDAAAAWVGMPDYQNPDATFTLVVNFRTEKDKAEFLKAMKIDKTRDYGKKMSSIWWPARTHDDLMSLRFDEGKSSKSPQAKLKR